MNLAELCRELKNWFDVSRYFGTFTVSGGEINLSDMVTDGSLQEGQYFRVVGSVFNDGVYQYPATGLQDETFDGAVWAMAVPPEVISLAASIGEWQVKNADALNSPFQSESFGGYSYTKATGAGATGTVTWQDQFAGKLKQWRKVRP